MRLHVFQEKSLFLFGADKYLWEKKTLVGMTVMKTKLFDMRDLKRISKIWKPRNTETISKF